MRFLKEKKEIIISFIIGVIIASGVTVYATGYLASQVTYKDAKTVEQALNELYEGLEGPLEYQSFNSNGFVSRSSAGTYATKTISIPEGKKRLYIINCEYSTFSAAAQTITSSIITNQTTTQVRSDVLSGVVDCKEYLSIIDTNGQSGNLTINYNCGGANNNSKHCAQSIVFYK